MYLSGRLAHLLMKHQLVGVCRAHRMPPHLQMSQPYRDQSFNSHSGNGLQEVLDLRSLPECTSHLVGAVQLVFGHVEQGFVVVCKDHAASRVLRHGHGQMS